MNGMLIGALCSGMGILSTQASAGEVSPQLISFQCRNCHAAVSHPLPGLHALSSETISRALIDFKYDRRDSTVMGRLAKGFSDAEIHKLAEWIATHPI